MNSTIRKSSYNFWFGILGQVVTIVCGILIPRYYIVSYGSNINGFINSVSQLFAYISLLEAGVGSASLQAMYRPVAEGNKKQVQEIIAATNYYYKRTGIIYIILIALMSIFYPLMIKSNINHGVMMGLILFSGMGGCLTYFFQGKYIIFLKAEGKNYVMTNIATASSVLLNISKIILLLKGCDVLVVQSCYLVLNALQSVYFMCYVRKNYPWLLEKAKPNLSAISQKNSVLIHQIASLIFNNTDMILLSIFADLNSASIYAVYKYLISLISTFISNCTNSVNFKMGQLFHIRERFLKIFDIFETFHITLTFSLCTIAYCFMNPFLTLYTKGFDINYILTYMPLLTITIEILNYGRAATNNVITFAGHFKETQNRAIIEMSLNLGLSLVFVRYFGIYGVLMGTVVALLYRVNDIIIYVNKRILNRSPWNTYRTWICNIVISIILVLIVENLPLDNGTYIKLIKNAAIVSFIAIPVFFVTNFMINSNAKLNLLDVLHSLKGNKKYGR